MVFIKCRIRVENSVIMGIYDHSHFREIFPEEKLKKYLEELEKIWNQEREMC
jgi:hypothetical protein